MKHSSYIEHTLDIDEEPTDLLINYTYDSLRNDVQLGTVERADDGTQLILTSDLEQEVLQFLEESLGDVAAIAEGEYADYRYEQYRDELLMEKWDA